MKLAIAKRCLFIAACLPFAVGGCSVTPEGEVEASAVGQAIVGTDSYLYLRCGATGWQPDASTRLRPGSDIYTFVIVYQVKEPWLAGREDTCVLTETPERDGWGTWQKHYGVRSSLPVAVPGGDRLRSVPHESEGTFGIKYETLGTYKMEVNWRGGAFSIEKVDDRGSPASPISP